MSDGPVSEDVQPPLDAAAEADAHSPRAGGWRAVLSYTLLRLALLGLALVALAALGLRGLMLLLVGFLVSGLLSFVILDRRRDEVSLALSGVFGSINSRIAANNAREDERLDAAERASGNPDSDAESHAERQEQQTGSGQGGDEIAPDRP